MAQLRTVSLRREELPTKPVHYRQTLPQHLICVHANWKCERLRKIDIEAEGGPFADNPMPPLPEVKTELVRFVGQERQAADMFMPGEPQPRLREALLRHHQPQADAQVLGFLGKRLDLFETLLPAVILAFDNAEHRPAAEGPADEHVDLAEVAE